MLQHEVREGRKRRGCVCCELCAVCATCCVLCAACCVGACCVGACCFCCVLVLLPLSLSPPYASSPALHLAVAMITRSRTPTATCCSKVREGRKKGAVCACELCAVWATCCVLCAACCVPRVALVRVAFAVSWCCFLSPPLSPSLPLRLLSLLLSTLQWAATRFQCATAWSLKIPRATRSA